MTDTSDAALGALWNDYREAANPNGSIGNIDLYDIDDMFEAAQAMWASITALRAERDAAKAAAQACANVSSTLRAERDNATMDGRDAYAPLVKVKPLVWEAQGSLGGVAKTPFGNALVSMYDCGWGWWSVGDNAGDPCGFEDTQDAAKAAAQADHDARIRNALIWGE